MSTGSYTELFFLDEATGLAAGHRPCFECRRSAATDFARAISKGHRSEKPLRAAEISALILSDIKPYIRRYDRESRQDVSPKSLPDGAMFSFGEDAYLKFGNEARLWTFGGYGPQVGLPDVAQRLTRNATCNALLAGYSPQIHPSAFQ